MVHVSLSNRHNVLPTTYGFGAYNRGALYSQRLDQTCRSSLVKSNLITLNLTKGSQGMRPCNRICLKDVSNMQEPYMIMVHDALARP